jgi:hypothetical protein
MPSRTQNAHFRSEDPGRASNRGAAHIVLGLRRLHVRSQFSVLSLSVTRPLLSERPVMAASSGRMITKRFVAGCGLHGELCPILGADWERRSAASCGQMRPGAVIVAILSASDVLERHQAAALFACVLSSGRRGRRFKSGHPDQVKGHTARSGPANGWC